MLLPLVLFLLIVTFSKLDGNPNFLRLSLFLNRLKGRLPRLFSTVEFQEEELQQDSTGQSSARVRPLSLVPGNGLKEDWTLKLLAVNKSFNLWASNG